LSFVGAFRLLPVSRLCFARPFAVKPAPRDAGNFSPRPTLNLTVFFAMHTTVPSPLTSHVIVLQD